MGAWEPFVSTIPKLEGSQFSSIESLSIRVESIEKLLPSLNVAKASHEKKIGHRDCSPWAHGDQNGLSQPWLRRDLGLDWAVT